MNRENKWPTFFLWLAIITLGLIAFVWIGSVVYRSDPATFYAWICDHMVFNGHRMQLDFRSCHDYRSYSRA